MTAPPIRTCWLCHAPIIGIPTTTGGFIGFPGWPDDSYAHGACADAWIAGDTARLAAARATACAAGHHRFPGRWTLDPDDPDGQAALWACAHGCGHVQRHPGYGRRGAS